MIKPVLSAPVYLLQVYYSTTSQSDYVMAAVVTLFQIHKENPPK